MNNIQNITDEELIHEFNKRFGENNEKNIQYKELIKELANVNSKLVASEKLKTNFLSNIRNEINNPLAAVLELSRNISDGSCNEEKTKKFAKIIHSEIFSLEFQLRNIFFSAEAEAGELSLSIVSMDVTKMIQNVIASFQHLITKKNLSLLISNNIASTDTIFETDAEKLHVILSNLIANAIQYSDDCKSIEIIAEISDHKLKVSIKDYGLGIDEKNKELLFDRFRQGQEGSTKSYTGHGLGLSISQSLLEIINGELIIESEPGKGSVFTIVLHESKKTDTDDIVLSNNGNDFLFQDPNSMIF